MPVTLDGSSIPVQRVIRRYFDYLKTTSPTTFKLASGSELATMAKAMAISILEEMANLNEPSTTTGAITLDMTTESTLEPIPYDKDV